LVQPGDPDVHKQPVVPHLHGECWYDSAMTTVDILFSYAVPPTERTVFALSGAKDVYGIRSLTFDHPAHTLRVEYDATRLTPAAVTKLVREAGLESAAELPLLSPVEAPVPVAAG